MKNLELLNTIYDSLGFIERTDSEPTLRVLLLYTGDRFMQAGSICSVHLLERARCRSHWMDAAVQAAQRHEAAPMRTA